MAALKKTKLCRDFPTHNLRSHFGSRLFKHFYPQAMSVSDLEAVLRRAACGMGLLRPSPPPYPPPAYLVEARDKAKGKGKARAKRKNKRNRRAKGKGKAVDKGKGKGKAVHVGTPVVRAVAKTILRRHGFLERARPLMQQRSNSLNDSRLLERAGVFYNDKLLERFNKLQQFRLHNAQRFWLQQLQRFRFDSASESTSSGCDLASDCDSEGNILISSGPE